jgi:hypothetical protein
MTPTIPTTVSSKTRTWEINSSIADVMQSIADQIEVDNSLDPMNPPRIIKRIRITISVMAKDGNGGLTDYAKEHFKLE